MSDDHIPWSKNGWTGYITEYRGTPLGLFTLRFRKGARYGTVEKLEAHQIETFDPDKWWNNENTIRRTKNLRAIKEQS